MGASSRTHPARWRRDRPVKQKHNTRCVRVDNASRPSPGQHPVQHTAYSVQRTTYYRRGRVLKHRDTVQHCTLQPARARGPAGDRRRPWRPLPLLFVGRTVDPDLGLRA